MKPIIYPYKMGSRSASALADALGTRQVFSDRKYKLRPNHVVINWGSSTVPDWGMPTLNHPLAVAKASNKLYAFQYMKEAGVSIPEFTTDAEIAYHQWWIEESRMVMARTKLTGTQGEGCYCCDPSYPLSEGGIDPLSFAENNSQGRPVAKLYTKYIKKTAEFRVHVFQGKVIDVQRKRKREGFEDANYQVRNHANGWVYTRGTLYGGCGDDDLCLVGITSEATKAVSSLGLDFGAVDVIWNKHYARAYVLEVNTAPGLEGTTLELYTQAIQEGI